MIREDLLEFQYYLDRLSMFMKESYGITEHTELFYRQLYQVNKQFDIFFNNLDIIHNENIPSEMIDLIGSIFECYRQFTIQLEENGSSVYKNINLSDEEFLTYIKCQIVKQNFKGTNEELLKLYSNNESQGLVNLNFLYILFENQGSLNCDIYFMNYNSYNENIQNLFSAGYLTIESMGIKYNRILANVGEIAVFAPDGMSSGADYYKFDTGRFA